MAARARISPAPEESSCSTASTLQFRPICSTQKHRRKHRRKLKRKYKDKLVKSVELPFQKNYIIIDITKLGRSLLFAFISCLLTAHSENSTWNGTFTEEHIAVTDSCEEVKIEKAPEKNHSQSAVLKDLEKAAEILKKLYKDRTTDRWPAYFQELIQDLVKEGSNLAMHKYLRYHPAMMPSFVRVDFLVDVYNTILYCMPLLHQNLIDVVSPILEKSYEWNIVVTNAKCDALNGVYNFNRNWKYGDTAWELIRFMRNFCEHGAQGIKIEHTSELELYITNKFSFFLLDFLKHMMSSGNMEKSGLLGTAWSNCESSMKGYLLQFREHPFLMDPATCTQKLEDFVKQHSLVESVNLSFMNNLSIVDTTKEGRSLLFALISYLLTAHSGNSTWNGTFNKEDIMVAKSWINYPKVKIAKEPEMVFSPKAALEDLMKVAEIIEKLYKYDSAGDLPAYFQELIQDLKDNKRDMLEPKNKWFTDKYLRYHPAMMPSFARGAVVPEVYNTLKCCSTSSTDLQQKLSGMPIWNNNEIKKIVDGVTAVLDAVYTYNGNKYGETVWELVRFMRNFYQHGAQGTQIKHLNELELCIANKISFFLPRFLKHMLSSGIYMEESGSLGNVWSNFESKMKGSLL